MELAAEKGQTISCSWTEVPLPQQGRREAEVGVRVPTHVLGTVFSAQGLGPWHPLVVFWVCELWPREGILGAQGLGIPLMGAGESPDPRD